MKLAREIVSIFYGATQAEGAETAFVKLFQDKQTPSTMEELPLTAGLTVAEVLIKAGLAASKGEARRLVAQGGVRLDGDPLEQADAPFPHPGVLQAGKRRFVRIV
jgi:tyrosyl-tRNA synthetase